MAVLRASFKSVAPGASAEGSALANSFSSSALTAGEMPDGLGIGSTSAVAVTVGGVGAGRGSTGATGGGATGGGAAGL